MFLHPDSRFIVCFLTVRLGQLSDNTNRELAWQNVYTTRTVSGLCLSASRTSPQVWSNFQGRELPETVFESKSLHSQLVHDFRPTG